MRLAIYNYNMWHLKKYFKSKKNFTPKYLKSQKNFNSLSNTFSHKLVKVKTDSLDPVFTPNRELNWTLILFQPTVESSVKRTDPTTSPIWSVDSGKRGEWLRERERERGNGREKKRVDVGEICSYLVSSFQHMVKGGRGTKFFFFKKKWNYLKTLSSMPWASKIVGWTKVLEELAGPNQFQPV